ncbi:MAG: phosphoglucomutase [Rhodothermales bacterium]|jgi:phosphoglucomutase
MSLHPLAGQPVPADFLDDIPALLAAYSSPTVPLVPVGFGTSGHRGSSIKGSFNETHILAITQALCEFRKEQGIDGPVYLGIDTHALSKPAADTALRVLAANVTWVRIPQDDGYSPTPVVSHAILDWNRNRESQLADGIIITPSHNPPKDGGFKYNCTDGGPASTDITNWVEDRANALIANGNRDVATISLEDALAADSTERVDFVTPYVDDLVSVIDIAAIREAGVRIGVDPLGGASVDFWQAIAKRHNLDITVVNKGVDPTFSFMCVDRDGAIRMDCSSPYAMAGLIALKDDFDVAMGNDPDADRHGIVTPSGLMNPNHYLSVAVDYLLANRPNWPAGAVGKTVVTSDMVGRVATDHGHAVREVPVGFKWFVDGLIDGSCVFGGEESAGASFLRHDGTVWTTDKDGLILGLLAAEIVAKTGQDPAARYAALTERHGTPCYDRIDAPADAATKALLKALSPEQVSADTLAGDPITECLVAAPGNGAAIGGLKVCSAYGWFAARPSGTEDVYKIYAESFRDAEHLARIQREAQEMVNAALAN